MAAREYGIPQIALRLCQGVWGLRTHGLPRCPCTLHISSPPQRPQLANPSNAHKAEAQGLYRVLNLPDGSFIWRVWGIDIYELKARFDIVEHPDGGDEQGGQQQQEAGQHQEAGQQQGQPSNQQLQEYDLPLMQYIQQLVERYMQQPPAPQQHPPPPHPLHHIVNGHMVNGDFLNHMMDDLVAGMDQDLEEDMEQIINGLGMPDQPAPLENPSDSDRGSNAAVVMPPGSTATRATPSARFRNSSNVPRDSSAGRGDDVHCTEQEGHQEEHVEEVLSPNTRPL